MIDNKYLSLDSKGLSISMYQLFQSFLAFCTPGLAYNTSTGSCYACPVGQYAVHGECKQCPAHQIVPFSGGQCGEYIVEFLINDNFEIIVNSFQKNRHHLLQLVAKYIFLSSCFHYLQFSDAIFHFFVSNLQDTILTEDYSF